ncbi:hypothetical protein SAE01_40340 [Segetibacter aerophilus]|uniref:Uncharacterized protein n=2 Tax=Segetibacter aerophilus TaxID=670293 RepID=A0A512BHV0_9BACT|nr:hypothetical protein SAE01_40340 [Segetibacter aerophilus]
MLSQDARKLADEAKSKGMWLYDPSYRWWYSPEDFKHIFQYANASEEFLKGLQIRHPNEGIQAGFLQLNKLHTKLQVFTKRVVDYYRK